ncbi:MAG: HNH endonuclease signature motif containing protein [Chloroflexi bacterium]|nr:HNH endonuclease signature motif containing protein [Chloroflexota bacterium]
MAFLFDFDEPMRSRPRFTQREKEALHKEQSGKCNGCGKRFDLRNMTVDHIRPFSKGGGERLSNLQLLCGACNSLKGNGTMGELRKKLRQQGIVKPSPSSKSSPSRPKSAAKTVGTTGKPTAARGSTAKKRAATKKRQTQRRDPVEKFLDDILGF